MSHSPFPFLGGVYFNLQPSTLCTCYTHTTVGKVAGLTQSPHLLLLGRGFDKEGKGRSYTRPRFQAMERRKRGREEQHQRPGESGKGHSFFVV